MLAPYYRWNAGGRLRYAARHPLYALRSAYRELTGADERFLARVTETSAGLIRRHIHEPFTHRDLTRHLRTCRAAFPAAQATHATFFGKTVLYQYAIIRALRPALVVETGVASGVSTSYILLALTVNGTGTLHSIDVDDPAYVPPGKALGWVVPEWLRARWTLHRGDAREVLPHLLPRLPLLDVFIHDSLHTYDHMMFEFATAYPRIRPGGFMLADDALWNEAFERFGSLHPEADHRVVRGLGVLRKGAHQAAVPLGS